VPAELRVSDVQLPDPKKEAQQLLEKINAEVANK
jgi:hypothetical protein